MIIVLVALLISGILIYIVNYRGEKQSEQVKERVAEYEAEKTQQEEDYKFKLLASEVSEETDSLFSAYDVLDGSSNGEVIVDSVLFSEKAELISAYSASYASAVMDVSCSLETSDIAILQFKAYTGEGAGWLEVSCGGDSNSVWVSQTPTTYYIPINYSVSEIQFSMDASDFVKTTIDEVYLVKYSNVDITDLRTGIYEDYECDVTILSAEDFEIEIEATQCLINEDYLYALSTGSLEVYKILEDGYEKVAEYSGMGDTRDMAFTNDRQGIVVSARLNGMYIFDISSPEELNLASHYATLEHSTGIFVSGDYAFVCSRYFGIEIVDISDINNPSYVNQVGASAEYQDCFVSDGYLYVGVYGQKRIDIYNIEDLMNPVLCSQIELDGNGQGVYVSNGILYAATGRDSADTSNTSSDLADFGKGTGNGLEIYDISDPENPVHLSTSKTLGRLSYSSRDVWDVLVEGNYAYLCSRYNGLYVFDVSDPEAPVCVDIINIEAESDSSLYESFDSETYAFPYDTDSIARGCIYHVCLQNGYLYAVASNMGIYRIDAEYINEAEQANVYDFSVSEKESFTPSISECTVELYENVNSIYAVAAYEGYYYVACGDGGIEVLDSDLNLMTVYETDYAVLDIKVISGYLYSAESEGGLGIWSISGDELERISTYCPSSNRCFSSIALTTDGNYCIAQVSSSSYLLIDLSDKYNPTSAGDSDTGVGSMYYRNVCAGVADNYLCVYGRKLQCWYYYNGTSLEYLGGIDNSELYSEAGGMTAVGDYAVYIKPTGYYYYNPSTDTTSEKIKIDDVTLKGKCFSNGSLLVVVDEYSGNIVIENVEDIDNPICVAEFLVEGNPDVGTFDGDYLLIPCRNYGLLKIDISGYTN